MTTVDSNAPARARTPRRVAVVTTVHVPGDTRVWHKETRSLAAAGHEVHFFACGLADHAGADGIVLHDLGPRILSVGARLRRLVEVGRRVAAVEPDVVHFHDPELLPALTLAAAGRPWRLVYDIHENIRQQLRIKAWLPGPLRRPVAAVYGLLERLCLRRVALCVLAEDSYAPEYAGRRTVIVKNYPVLSRVVDAPRVIEGPPRFCYVGGVSEERGAPELIEAFASVRTVHPGATLRIAGPIHPPLSLEGLRARAVALDVEDAVELSGRVPLDEAYAIMAGADVGVAPLRAVGNYVGSLPTKMFEYMSCALPVVISDFPLWRAIVADAGCGGVFTPGDADALAAALLESVADPEAYARRSAAGLAAVKDRYGWEHEFARLSAAYDALDGEAS